MTASSLASAAKRGSPPGTSDCSGSQNFTEPLLVVVLIAESAWVPPMASAALLTRPCSFVVVAQESRKHAPASAARLYLMISSCGMGRRRTLLQKSYSRRGGPALIKGVREPSPVLVQPVEKRRPAA